MRRPRASYSVSPHPPRAKRRNRPGRWYLVAALVIASLSFGGTPTLAGDGSSQLGLPWASGRAWTLSGGPHAWGGNIVKWNSLDFAGGDGHVHAAAEGKVRYLYCNRRSEFNMIMIDHTTNGVLNGWHTSYYHLGNLNTTVRDKWVSRGTYLGDTSTNYPCGGVKPTGPHVHFSLWRFSGSYAQFAYSDGQAYSFDDLQGHQLDIGGWTVRAIGGKEYCGSMKRIAGAPAVPSGFAATANAGPRSCGEPAPHMVYNDGLVGSGDTTAPRILDVGATVASSGVTITWTTSESATSQVEYGTSATYGSSTTLSSALVVDHRVSLPSGLRSGTIYHYRVRSSDASKNLATSGDFTFATLAAPGQGVVAPPDEEDAPDAPPDASVREGPQDTAQEPALPSVLDPIFTILKDAFAAAGDAVSETVQAVKQMVADTVRTAIEAFLSFLAGLLGQ